MFKIKKAASAAFFIARAIRNIMLKIAISVAA